MMTYVPFRPHTSNKAMLADASTTADTVSQRWRQRAHVADPASLCCNFKRTMTKIPIGVSFL